MHCQESRFYVQSNLDYSNTQASIMHKLMCQLIAVDGYKNDGKVAR